MSNPTAPSAPDIRTVVTEQVRAVGLAVRREALLLSVGLGLLVLFTALVALVPELRVQVDGELPLNLNPEDLGYLAMAVAIFSPLAVWKGEAPWGDTQLWSLPVDRPLHALTKVAAGWLWLMGIVAAGVVAFGAAAMLSGGELGIETTRLVVVDPVAAADGGAAGTAPLVWSTPLWQWALPFTAATAIYLFATALWLGTPHPWRWLAGIYLAVLAVGGFLEMIRVPSLESAATSVLGSFDQLASSGVETLRRYTRTESGELVRSWWALPSAGRWAGAAVPWIGAGLAAVFLAARRHREG